MIRIVDQFDSLSRFPPDPGKHREDLDQRVHFEEVSRREARCGARKLDVMRVQHADPAELLF
jgi:hypothetical protein